MARRKLRPRAVGLTAVSCAVALALSAGVAGPAAASPDGVGPVFVDGQAQIVPDFSNSSSWIRQRLWVETEFDSDGDGKLDRMHVDVTRPAQTEQGLKVPVVYESSPYYAGTASSQSQYFWNVRHELGAQPPARLSPPPIAHQPGRTSVSTSEVNTWVPRGFAVVHSDSPGTGLSQGCPTVGAPNESLAPKAVIDWLNGRAKGYTSVNGDQEVSATGWATGKVGMTGTSYNGTLPLAAATTGVDGLEAIIPIAPNTSYYHYYRSNGLVRNPGGWVGEDIDYLFDYINSGYPERRAYCIDTIRVGEMNRYQDRANGDYNDFWAGRDYLHAVGNVKAATLMAHGFNDWNVVPEHSVRILEALKAQGTPVQAYYHQGGHGGAPPLDMRNRWFTRYLYGVQNGVENDARAWVVRNETGASQLTPYADYPNPAAAPVTMVLKPGGNTTGELTSLARPGSGVESLVDAGNTACNAGALATTVSDHRLLYATPELTAPVHISGTAEVTLRMSASKPAANLSVALVRLPWTGGSGCESSTRGTTTSIITRGWADPQNRHSLTRSEPLVPGEFVDVTVPLQPDDQVIPAGYRIGLMVFSTDHEFTLHPAPGTVLNVDLAATALRLPVVGGPLAMPVCVSTDARTTVVVGGVDSGVPNHPLAGNCTINDHLLDGEQWSNHGQFVTHVNQVVDQLVAAGVVTSGQRGSIVSAAARSRVGR
ncbi:Xaa-Pro dipeptidyl-peptidase [Micromonospora sp. DR5-3]|uniref:Xaa-Pro dipeptidyl-peptidase n=1 Tax=unclassified Micromonospora TaxID=2617518 RepID=UPI0011D3EB29|nr:MULTISPECIES: Xaa-Pro dipeptidyl-peptidase [unclassified Micromonospora]MCW3814326.1 Xaa-Pro dipeptidyl-peptidase [Micromonospora sp. DR5-3]TYC23359.1 Xaa-Pro dipeptidyl-peptidase [Micromonospora sp. MP36]